MCWSEYNKQIKSVQTKFNWGQININLVNQKVIKAKGGWRFVVPHHEEALLSLDHLWLEINVDLTPIIQTTPCSCESQS